MISEYGREQILFLDVERRAIEQRMYVRSAIRNKSKVVQRVDGTRSPITPADKESLLKHDAYNDLMRYVNIESEQWRLITGGNNNGSTTQTG